MTKAVVQNEAFRKEAWLSWNQQYTGKQPLLDLLSSSFSCVLIILQCTVSVYLSIILQCTVSVDLESLFFREQNPHTESLKCSDGFRSTNLIPSRHQSLLNSYHNISMPRFPLPWRMAETSLCNRYVKTSEHTIKKCGNPTFIQATHLRPIVVKPTWSSRACVDGLAALSLSGIWVPSLGETNFEVSAISNSFFQTQNRKS